MGIYLNGGRKEEGLLLNFWKDNVSQAYKNLKEQKKQQDKLDRTFQKQHDLREMEKKDPAQYRRIMIERE